MTASAHSLQLWDGATWRPNLGGPQWIHWGAQDTTANEFMNFGGWVTTGIGGTSQPVENFARIIIPQPGLILRMMARRVDAVVAANRAFTLRKTVGTGAPTNEATVTILAATLSIIETIAVPVAQFDMLSVRCDNTDVNPFIGAFLFVPTGDP